MEYEETDFYCREEQERLDQRANYLWRKKIRWRLATHEELREFIQITGLNPLPEIEEVPAQFCEFDNAADFLHWRVFLLIGSLQDRLMKVLHTRL